jgi:hypothetical protein
MENGRSTRMNADLADLRQTKDSRKVEATRLVNSPVLIRENPINPRSSASHSLQT